MTETFAQAIRSLPSPKLRSLVGTQDPIGHYVRSLQTVRLKDLVGQQEVSK